MDYLPKECGLLRRTIYGEYVRRNFLPRSSKLQDKCVICFGIKYVGIISLQVCKHSFHRECIKKWLVKSDTCPICRSKTIYPFLL